MPICAYGASVRDDAPETFEFEGAWIINLLSTVLGFIPGLAVDQAVEQISLPIGPQDTAAFVAVEPSGELPTTQDMITLTLFPPWALISGAYVRLGNWLRLMKWQELAVCNPPPEGTPGWAAYCILEVAVEHGELVVADVCPPGEPGDVFRFRRMFGSASSGTQIEFGLVKPVVVEGDPLPAYSPADNWAQVHPIGTGEWIGGPSDSDDPLSGYRPIAYKLSGGNTVDPNLQAMIEVQRAVVVFQPTEPELPEPAIAPGCPDPTDLQQMADFYCDVQGKLQRIEAIVEWLAAIALPPTFSPDAETTEVDPESPLAKPADAIGAVIEVTAPLRLARYGRNPGVVFNAGHVSIGTTEGWLPSVQLKHEKQVVWPLPPSATQLGLDLELGVIASVRWLRAPK